MPSLGADMEAATLIQWLVKPGDNVKKGDVILVVETNKGAIDVEVFESGVVDKLLVVEQDKVPVGTVLALIRTEDATLPNSTASATRSTSSIPAKIEINLKAPAPVAQPAAIVATNTEHRRYASPAARRHAKQAGVPLEAVKGSGPRGAVLYADIDIAASAKPVPLKPAQVFNADAMRQAIAAAMAKSKREIPHYYLATSVDMSAAQHWVENYNQTREPEQRLLMSVLLIKATALALKEFPEMNGFYQDGHFNASSEIHPGFAINMRGGGLMTPALHNSDTLSLPNLMEKLQDLVQRTRRGKLRSSEMMDATITITALGERGVEKVFGVIYPPQVAIVGFGKISLRPWVINDAIAIHPIMDISLAADHRVSDGHRGALFLNAINQHLQNPDQL